jgi:uncharacterized protein
MNQQLTQASLNPQIQTGAVCRNDFRPAPIEPSWIIDGNPTARSVALTRGKDGKFASGLWECTAGRFKYIFPDDEVVHILEGEVHLREENGAEHLLRPGDTAYFPQGLTSYWTIPQYLKKFAIFHTPTRSLSQRILGKIKKLVKRTGTEETNTSVLGGEPLFSS